MPDTTLDLKRDSSFPYNNSGANVLRDAVDDRGLIDVVRETIGNDPYFSSHHVVAGGTCWSRIDQIYAPHESDTHYTIGEGDIFPRASAIELDHTMVDVRALKVKPEKGKDLPRINESIFDEPAFNAQLHATIQDAHLRINAMKPDGWRKGWEALKVELKRMCLEQTKSMKYKASMFVKRKRDILKRLDTLIQKGTAAPSQ